MGATADGRFAADREAERLWRKCAALPNVHVMGHRPHDRIPDYLRHMDVNAMVYRTSDGGWWSEIFPLKSFEYLAAGRPIVSAPVVSLAGFSASMAFAATADEWIVAIEHALTDGGVGTERSRRAVAAANTWEHRIDRLEDWILDLPGIVPAH